MRADKKIGAGEIGVVCLLLACLGGGAAMAADPTPAKAGAKPGGKVHVYDTNRINVNTASKSELMKLEGMSAATAEKIVAYRETHGRFKRLQDVQRIAGRGVVEMNAGRLTVK